MPFLLHCPPNDDVSLRKHMIPKVSVATVSDSIVVHITSMSTFHYGTTPSHARSAYYYNYLLAHLLVNLTAHLDAIQQWTPSL